MPEPVGLLTAPSSWSNCTKALTVVASLIDPSKCPGIPTQARLIQIKLADESGGLPNVYEAFSLLMLSSIVI